VFPWLAVWSEQKVQRALSRISVRDSWVFRLRVLIPQNERWSFPEYSYIAWDHLWSSLFRPLFLRLKSSHNSLVPLILLLCIVISLLELTVTAESPIINVSPSFRIPYCLSRNCLLYRYGVRYGLARAPKFLLQNARTCSSTGSYSLSSSSSESVQPLLAGRFGVSKNPSDDVEGIASLFSDSVAR
jgi:hypothetical protein